MFAVGPVMDENGTILIQDPRRADPDGCELARASAPVGWHQCFHLLQ